MNDKTIIIWGTARRTAMYRKWLEENYIIKAYVKTNGITGDIYGVPVITSDDVANYDFDILIIAVEVADVESIKHEIAKIDKQVLDKCVTIDELVSSTVCSDYVDFTTRRQLRVIHELLSATDQEIKDYEWMLSKVATYGTFCFDENDWNEKSPDYNWAVYGLQQVPEEFSKFCIMLANIRVDTAAEVGVYRGRSAFFICAILARKNPSLKYKMIDICDRIDDFDEFKKVLPQLEKCIPSTSDDYKGKAYDFVFIDADHSYDASINDYNNIGINAKKLVAFHDIYAHEYDHENGGTVRMWQEVMERTKEKEHLIYSKYPDKWMGIGCVKVGE